MGIGDEEAGASAQTQQGNWDSDDLKWHRTPWYIFWRPKWRRSTIHGFHDERDMEYASDQQRARQVLEERCCPTRPRFNSAGYGR